MEIRPILSALLRNKTGAVLVAVQVALSLAILANALHIVNIRQAVAARPSGMADENAVFYINARGLASEGAEQELATQKRETAILRAVPGVLSVAKTNQMPMARSGSTTSVSVDRKQVNESASASQYISPDSLVHTLGLKISEGRDFRPSDVMEIDEKTSTAFPNGLLVTRALAEKIWPGGGSAVGKTVYFGTGENANSAQVVGVIERFMTTHASADEEAEYSLILPVRLAGGNNPGNTYAVRAEPGQRDRVMKEAEEALRKASPTPIIFKTRTANEDRKERYRADMAMSWMLVTVSVLLLLITASGIVGMASLWVTQRRKQIGVRRALGARRVDILRYFIIENVMITSTGVVAGVMLAVGLNQLLVSKLEMARLPLGYVLAGAGVFWALGVAAVYGPAWRAATISPALATRSA
ncbi:ABC transporter permease [Massilia cavernae]|uniref:FtsX-like permease family protein n=1 Tax=Massilia cavernae TaxID=2320864 RepID=A0A418Y6V0_9BURK|nr:FtsX-like permease family protein [Massilia cavernae]RJG24185.1 FtsX-like permease family protein [Massilia cavernae]